MKTSEAVIRALEPEELEIEILKSVERRHRKFYFLIGGDTNEI